MWQRFTERARKVVFYAQEEAQKFGEGYVSTEHILLGLLREDDSVAARVLMALGLTLEQVRGATEGQLSRSEARPSQDMTLTPRCKRVIDLAYDEARNLNHNYIGTEHLLMGLIREGNGLAGRVLAKLGVEEENARLAMRTIQEQEVRENVAPPVTPSPRPVPRQIAPPTDVWASLDRPLQRVVVFGEMEAMRRGQTFLSTEHLLLGLLREPDSVAARALAEVGIDLDALREATVARCRDSGTPIKGEAVLSAASVHAFRLAYQEQATFDAPKAGAEHLLLALVREPDGVAGRVLEEFGVDSGPLSVAIRRLCEEEG